MLLAGEPGIGKTRLLAETSVRAFASGAIVLAGRAPEETLVPYQPFLEALGHYISRAPLEELRAARPLEYGAELGRLIPSCAAVCPSSPRLTRAIRRPIATGCSRRWPGCWPRSRPQWCRAAARARRPALGRQSDAAAVAPPGALCPQSTRVSILGAYRDVEPLERGLRAPRWPGCAASG